ncbi:MAG: glycosyl hydrolase [Jatrophihabitans sp.]
MIRAYATGLKAFAHPVFLRWYWEMNHLGHHSECGAGQNPDGFVAAWKHIWTIFAQTGAANVAFVWCPGGSRNTAPFYPGDHYVDWIGDDHFDDQGEPTTGTAAVDNVFGAFYKQWSSHGLPMMIGATGAKPSDQAGYLQGLRVALPKGYPAVKALVYFDAAGDNGKGPWNLQGSGVAAFKELAADPYFSVGRH